MLSIFNEDVLDGWHLEVHSVGIAATDLEDEVITGDWLVSDFFVGFLDAGRQAGSVLVAWHVCVEERDVAAGDHRHVQVHGGLEVIDKSLESQWSLVDDHLVEDRVALGDSSDWAAHNRVVFLRLSALNFVGLAEEEQAYCQVDEGVLELLQLFEALHKLEDFICDRSRDHCSSRGNCRNDLASNQLRLMEVGLTDLVVTGPKVRRCSDEGDVVVRVIILLKISGSDLVCGHAELQLCELLNQIFNIFFVVHARGLHMLLRSRRASGFSCLSFLRSLNLDLLGNVGLAGVGLGHGSNFVNIVDLRDSEVERDQIRESHDVLQVKLFVRIERDWMWGTLGSRPERIAVLVFVVVWEDGLEIADIVVV